MSENEIVNGTLKTAGPPAPGPEGPSDALAARLEKMEALLAQQAENTRKTVRSHRITALLLAMLVLVVAGGLLWVNTTLADITRDVPQLISTTTRSIEQLETTLADIDKIDFEQMNSAIGEVGKGVAAMDFETLNASIARLNEVVESLSNVMGIFR